MAEYMLRVEDIRKSFGGVEALKGIRLEIRAGEIHCLAGENGSGKSTLIKIISGVYQADQGTFDLAGQRFSRISPIEAINRGLQVIYQDFSVFPNLTVKENLALNMELMAQRKLVSYVRMRTIAKQAVSRIGFEIDLDERVENLSVANRQLIAISRALLYNAKLIIMDEPTSALTNKEVRSLFSVIKSLQKEGISILFVSHKLDEVFEISERFTIIRNGENVATGRTSDLDRMAFAYYMTGREFQQESYKPGALDDEPVMSVRQLSLGSSYTGISFDLYAGEILGITGLLGSGRTELVQSLFGIYRPVSGTIEIEGKRLRPGSIKAAIRHGIGYVPADRLTEGLFLPQSIANNVVVSKLKSLSNALGFLRRRVISEEIRRWVSEFSIVTNDPALPVQTLSGGNQQKVVLARWLANELSVLILNGPTVGVDIGSKYDIHALLRSLAAQGLAIILISDDLPEILACTSRILVMRDGRVIEELETVTTTETRLAELSTGVA